VIALLDYKWLGQELEGAPDNDTKSLLLSLWDEQEKQKYPMKIQYTPHWFQEPKSIGTCSYFTWTYLVVCKQDNLPTSAEGKLWKDWIGILAV
jgi:hypothetical protein